MTSIKNLLQIRSLVRQLNRFDHHAVDLSKIYPKIGKREIVGFGLNGSPSYHDIPEFPAQAIRFKEDTPEILALREKEKGDWKKLTLDEKKTLYRASFCRTYAEMNAPTGRWKEVLALVLGCLSLSVTLYMLQNSYVQRPKVSTINKEKQAAMVEKMILARANPLTGVASKYDYENHKWK